MREFMKDPGYQNFACVFLALAYVGYQLQEYTSNGLKKVHKEICRNLGSQSKCIYRCSERYGRSVKYWCDTCRSWQYHLQKYMRLKTVAWERMESWKWPTSYINIVQVFLPTINSVHTFNLQDVYIQSYIWTNCKVFSIKQGTLRNLRALRNTIFHNSPPCVTDDQKENCFNTLQCLLNSRDINAHVNVFECKEFLECVKVTVPEGEYRILPIIPRLWPTDKLQDETKTDENESRNSSNYPREDNIYKVFQIHQNTLKSLTTVMIRLDWESLRFPGVLKLSCFLLTVILSLALFAGRNEWVWMWILFEILIIPSIPFVLTDIKYFILHRMIRFRQHLILRRLQPVYAKYPQLERQTGNLKYASKGEWDRCLNAEDIALLADLVSHGYLPNREQLNRACVIFSRSSFIIDLITEKICKNIKKQNDNKVKRVWAAYEPSKENNILFVVVTKGSDTNLEFKPEYDFVYREDGKFNSESKEVILEENARDLFPEEHDIVNARKCIAKYTPQLMGKHSNITIISASLLKSKGYGTNQHKTEKKICIVLHVHIKCLIPLKESLFPRHLEGIDVDVREGFIRLDSGKGKGPHEKHQQVKMGCGIKAKDQDASGTLGGFIEHPEHGLCALTCAHAIMDNIDEAQKFNKKNVVECIQPCYDLNNVAGSRFGVLKFSVTRKGSLGCKSVGFEYALIAIDTAREPLDGSFPFATQEEWEDAGFQSPMSFETGDVIDYKELSRRRSRCNVVKYGSTTILTCGTIRWIYPTVNFTDNVTGLTLLNQIQINFTTTGEKKRFSTGGDSGALIFHVDDDNKLTAVALLVGGHKELGFSVATPICAILADINVPKLKQFTAQNESENGYLHESTSPIQSSKSTFCNLLCRILSTPFTFCKSVWQYLFQNKKRK